MKRFYACTLAVLLAFTLSTTSLFASDCYSAASAYIEAEDTLAYWVRTVDDTLWAIAQPDFSNLSLYNLLNIAIQSMVEAAEVVSQKQQAMALACYQ